MSLQIHTVSGFLLSIYLIRRMAILKLVRQVLNQTKDDSRIPKMALHVYVPLGAAKLQTFKV